MDCHLVDGLNSDAFASTDSDMFKSIILIGTRKYVTPHNITLNLKNIPDYLSFKDHIHIRADDLYLKFVVVNKNPKSSDRWMVFDRFNLSSTKGGKTSSAEPKKLTEIPKFLIPQPFPP
jgi:hypothetical protein